MTKQNERRKVCARDGCEKPVIYSGTGPRPIYCSDRCRVGAWRERQRQGQRQGEK